MRFQTDHEFPADVAAVAAALLDPAFHTTLDLPDLARPEVVGSQPGRLELRYEFIGLLDPIARRLLAGRRLTWIQVIELDAEDGRGRLSFNAEAEAGRLFGAAEVALEGRADGGTQRVITGDLHVRVPLVGATAERRIVPGLVRRLDVEAAAAVTWLARA
jgi:hypothetical protein